MTQDVPENGFHQPLRLEKDQEKKLCDLYEQGRSIIALAKQFECEPEDVIGILDANGIALRTHPVRSGRTSLSEGAQNAIVADYRSGMTVARICEKHQTSPSMVYRVLRRHKVPRNRPGYAEPSLSDADIERIINLWLQGESYAKLAEWFGVTKSAIAYHITRRYPNGRPGF